MRKGICLLMILLLCAVWCAAGAEGAALPVCSLTLDGCLEWIRKFEPAAEVSWKNADWNIHVETEDGEFEIEGEMLANGIVDTFDLYSEYGGEEPDIEVVFPLYESALEILGDMTGDRFEGEHDAIMAATAESPAAFYPEGGTILIFPDEMSLEYNRDHPEEDRLRLDDMQEMAVRLFGLDHTPDTGITWIADLTGTGFLTMTIRIGDENILRGITLSDLRGEPEEMGKAFRSLAGLCLSGESLSAVVDLIDDCMALEDEKITKSFKLEGLTLQIRKRPGAKWTMTLSLRPPLLSKCAAFTGEGTSARQLAIAEMYGKKGLPVPAAAAPAAVVAQAAEPAAADDTPPPEYLVGLWKLTAMDLGDRLYKPAETGFRAYLDFDADTRQINYMTSMFDTSAEVGTMTYDVSGDQIMFHLLGLNEAGQYDPDRDIITGTFTWIGNVPVTIERAAPEDSMPILDKFELTADMEPLAGTWYVVRMKYGDVEYSGEELYGDGRSRSTLTLDRDGTAMFYNGSMLFAGFVWQYQDDAVVLRKPDNTNRQSFRYDEEQHMLVYTTKDSTAYYVREGSD